MSDLDVVVVGAGLAGLSVARRLHGAGCKVRVLEARDRVGGRVLTTHHAGAPFELGAQWVGPTQSRLRSLCEELDIELFAQYHRGKKILDLDGKISTYRGRIPSVGVVNLLQTELLIRELERMASHVPLDAPYRARKSGEWDGMTLESWKRGIRGNRDGKKLFDLAVRTVFGAEPAEVSLLYFLFYLNSAGGFRKLVEIDGCAQQDRFVLGASNVLTRLAAELNGCVELSSPVRRIDRDDEGVTVCTDEAELRARAVVVAVPPHLTSRIRYEPALPPLRDQLVQRWSMGATIKVLGFYQRTYWRDRGLSGEAIANRGPFSVVFDNTSRDGSVPCLLGFVVGKHARRWTRMERGERRKIAEREFARLFSLESSAMVDFIEQDWSAEPWTGGCPVSSLAPGALTTFAEVWRAPVERIHWAGTETARHWNGYLEGALESAERVASEVLARL